MTKQQLKPSEFDKAHLDAVLTGTGYMILKVKRIAPEDVRLDEKDVVILDQQELINELKSHLKSMVTQMECELNCEYEYRLIAEARKLIAKGGE